MDLETYTKIQKFCAKYLFHHLHNRHIEDLTQFVAMKHFEFKGDGNWNWFCSDYCRINGLGSRGKLGAKILESFSIPDYETSCTSEDERVYQTHTDSMQGVIELLLLPLGLNKETLRWAVKSYNKGKMH